MSRLLSASTASTSRRSRNVWGRNQKSNFEVLTTSVGAMIKNHKWIFKSNIQILFGAQSRGMCNEKHCDKIGPADPISNLRHVKYAVQENETAKERKLREHRQDLQTWNELFWTKHNLNFIEKKKEFQENELRRRSLPNKSLSPDDMSVFYKDFLDKHWKTHLAYLLEWYKRHAYVTFLHFGVVIEKLFKKINASEK